MALRWGESETYILARRLTIKLMSHGDSLSPTRPAMPISRVTRILLHLSFEFRRTCYTLLLSFTRLTTLLSRVPQDLLCLSFESYKTCYVFLSSPTKFTVFLPNPFKCLLSRGRESSSLILSKFST